jgi:hypothetical protein
MTFVFFTFNCVQVQLYYFLFPLPFPTVPSHSRDICCNVRRAVLLPVDRSLRPLLSVIVLQQFLSVYHL